MRVLEDMKEVLEDQLKKISKKGDAISPQELDNAYKAIDIIKDIATIEAMAKAEKEQEEMKQMEGQSKAGGYSMHMPMYYPSYMMPQESYEGSYAANSYARGGGRSYEGGSNTYSREGSYAGGSYAGGGQSRDGGQSNAYGQSNAGGQSNNMGQNPEYSEEYSERRGRSPRTGRYVSRDGGSYEGGSYDYSREDNEQKEQLKRQLKQMEQKLNQM